MFILKHEQGSGYEWLLAYSLFLPKQARICSFLFLSGKHSKSPTVIIHTSFLSCLLGGYRCSHACLNAILFTLGFTLTSFIGLKVHFQSLAFRVLIMGSLTYNHPLNNSFISINPVLQFLLTMVEAILTSSQKTISNKSNKEAYK